MSRIRTIYNNEALLVGPSPATGAHSTGNIKRIHRVQTIGNSFDASLVGIYEYGKATPTDRINLDGIKAVQNFSYLMVDFENESNLGFVIDSNTSAISHFLDKSEEDRNYFRFVAPEGLDAEGMPAASGAILAVGNGFMSSYSLEIAVGSFPTATLVVGGLNGASYIDGVAEQIPAIDPTTGRKASGLFTLPTIASPSDAKPTVLRPGDVKVNFSNTNAGVFQSLADDDINIQTATVAFDLNLEDIKGLGSRLTKSREIKFPIDVNVSIDALMSDLTSANLVDLLCDGAITDISFNLYNNDCDDGGPTLDDVYAKIIVKNARFMNTDLSGSIGPNDTVKMSFVGQVGASNDLTNGLFFSGVTGYTSSGTPVFSN